jgi:pyruvate dehydrogenase phosphatase
MKPEDFVYEEHNAATHLVQNAFGGARRGLFCGAMAEQYPLSRHARDDISVYVIFFGKVHGKSIVDEPMLRVV